MSGAATLLLDAGNTRLKWALQQGAVRLHQGVADYADLSAWQAGLAALPAPAKAVGCNVAGPARAAALAALLAPLPIVWLQAAAEQGGLRNHYREPARLGADRWAALLGARRHHTGDTVVVMAGTAMTVDALSREGDFLGGIIVPGFRLMRAALAQGTADLGLPEGDAVDFPRSTGEAIVNGALLALTGAILQMQQRLSQRTGRTATVLLSGGDADVLAPQLQAALAVPLIAVDNLVLDGLAQLGAGDMPEQDA
ncbi:type III pantothenate kinase [Chitinimonas sp. BJYL2]|uniref:type III pantothenate kinase n=1 Tax=Chitinimonas sp. BJYL2 TaxID=2976696 RepID=UPI0022B59248|nr:type III pantothenate kinase [Chitinimonas sp. BJYL2]